MNSSTILIVDNEKEVVDLVKLGLDIEGYKCIEAYSGRQALELLKKNEIDLILLDIMMDDMDGFETLREIRTDRKYDNIPILMLTAKPEDENVELTFAGGADDYIAKPFTFDILLARINKALARRKKNIDTATKISEIENIKNTFELILDNAGFGLILLSNHKDILFVNKFIKTVFIKNSDSNLNIKSNELFELCGIPAALLFNSPEKNKINYTHKIKNIHDADLTMYIEEYPVYSNKKEKIGVVQVLVDITEYKKIEELFLHSEKLASVGQLSASLAHEINNPLTLLSGILQMFKSSKKLPAEFQSDISTMLDITDRLKILIEKMLILSRKNDDTEKAEELSVIEIVEEAIRLVDYKFKTLRITIEKNYNLKERYVVQVAKWSMVHCLVNILINAIDASEKNGNKIIISIYKNGADVKISITDFGDGISDKVKENLFKPFFTTKQIGKGTGLGLYIVKHILETCSGSIDIQNAENHKGAVVTISLPIKN
ncbi:response regulator [Candidatus Dependentiae bacterium]|nr:response regulator [Candidatus Dependentiae bacterium]